MGITNIGAYTRVKYTFGFCACVFVQNGPWIVNWVVKSDVVARLVAFSHLVFLFSLFCHIIILIFSHVFFPTCLFEINLGFNLIIGRIGLSWTELVNHMILVQIVFKPNNSGNQVQE